MAVKATTMNCKHARTMIALLVGQDLDDAADHTLQKHMAACEECRSQAARMTTALRVLRDAEDVPAFSRQSSLWPSIARHVEARRATGLAEQFNGWVPALAVMAAGLLIAVFWNQSVPVSDPWHRNLSSREMTVYEDRDGQLYIDPSWAAQHPDAFSKPPRGTYAPGNTGSVPVGFGPWSGDF